VALCLARRHLPQGARGRPDRQPCRDSRRRGERGRQARGAGHRHGSVRSARWPTAACAASGSSSPTTTRGCAPPPAACSTPPCSGVGCTG
jgi:hypothetical protein